MGKSRDSALQQPTNELALRETQTLLFDEVVADQRSAHNERRRNRTKRDKDSERQLPRFIRVPIDTISEHVHVRHAWRDVGITVPWWVPYKLLTPKGLQKLALVLPIHVVEAEGNYNYLCFSNLRLLLLAKTILAPGSKIAVLRYDACDLNDIAEYTFIEFVVLAVWHRLDCDEMRVLYDGVLKRIDEVRCASTLIFEQTRQAWAGLLKIAFNTIRKPKPGKSVSEDRLTPTP